MPPTDDQPTVSPSASADLSVRCVSRWIDQGLTSRSNPVLRAAYQTYVAPLGLLCDSMEIEPFSVIETGAGGLLFNYPVFDPKAVVSPEVRALVERHPSVTAEVFGSGHAVFEAPNAGGAAWETVEEDMERLGYLLVAAINEAKGVVLASALALIDEVTPPGVKQAYLQGDLQPLTDYLQSAAKN